MTNKTPIILDTDIGSDIDDAVALAYLLRQPRCELVGITTVTGEPEKRAALADAICRAAGRSDIPIHAGTEHPILVPLRQTRADQAEALTDAWPHRTYTKENTALAFLRETIRARPGELTLLTIGPLTNIGLLFAIDPELPALLKALVMMGGRYFGDPSTSDRLEEWNILCDPHAAARVYAARPPVTLAAGLDVTNQCTMDANACRQRFAEIGGPLALVGAMAEVWFRHAGRITFHDPLAAALIFQPDICGYRDEHVEVDVCSPDTQGLTRLSVPASERPHRLADQVNSDAFFRHYFEVVAGGPV